MVEQDLLISRTLVALYQSPEIQKSLAFRGGTALNKLYVQPPARYSEDIDLVQIKPQPIGNVINLIREALEWLGEPRRKMTERSVKLIYRYTSLEGISAKLKIEINTTFSPEMHVWISDKQKRHTMRSKKLSLIHPGEILFEEFLKPMDISQYKLAKTLGISPMRISEIVRGKRSITADTALRLARCFNMEAKFWLNLQASYDLEKALCASNQKIFQTIKPLWKTA